MIRRNFIKIAGLGTLGLIKSDYTNFDYTQEQINNKKEIFKKEFSRIPSSDYYNVSHNLIVWKSAADGLDFSRVEVYREKELVDVIATVKINPEINKIRVFNGNTETRTESRYIESWQEKTGALAMINGNQYMSDPHLYPCALVICDGKQIGPKSNKYSRGMFVAEPKDLEGKLKKADLLDFDYDSFDYKTTPYTQGVQHWPILLDREGNIKVKETDLRANRTVIAKTKEDEILFMTSEGEYFTLYNLGMFLKESNERKDKGFNIHTAMNLDGGNTSEMIVKSNGIKYSNNVKTRIPGVIGVFSRY